MTLDEAKANVEAAMGNKERQRVMQTVARRCAEIAQEVIDGMDDPDFEFNCDIYGPIQFAIRKEFGLLKPHEANPDGEHGDRAKTTFKSE